METGFSIILIQAIHGLVYGMLLFLVASGLILVFGMMDVLDIADAGFYMLGAYIGSRIAAVTGNFFLALLAAPLANGFCWRTGGTIFPHKGSCPRSCL